jgi:hypothetical protein
VYNHDIFNPTLCFLWQATKEMGLMGAANTPAMPTPTKLMDQVAEQRIKKNNSIRTEKQYVQWIRRHILFHGKRHPNCQYQALVQSSIYRPWPGYRHPCRYDGVFGSAGLMYNGERRSVGTIKTAKKAVYPLFYRAVCLAGRPGYTAAGAAFICLRLI